MEFPGPLVLGTTEKSLLYSLPLVDLQNHSEPFLLQTSQSWFSQPLLINIDTPIPSLSLCHLVHLLHCVHVPPVLGSSEMDVALQTEPHRGE